MSRKTKAANASRQITASRRNFSRFAVVLVVILVGGLGLCWLPRLSKREKMVAFSDIAKEGTLRFKSLSLAEINLVCAQGLDNTNPIELNNPKHVIDTYATHVKSETERNHHRFLEDPAAFDGSEAKYRMIMMGVILFEDCGVHYNEKLKAISTTATDSEFLADSRTAFIAGPLDPQVGGTCASLPVLYAVIGREIGYPLKFKHTLHHLFLYWDSPQEHFNIEVTGKGVNFHDDDYYRQLDAQMDGGLVYTPANEKEEGFFRPSTPEEETAFCLEQRAVCLEARGRFAEASQAACLMTRISNTPTRTDYLRKLSMLALNQLNHAKTP